MKDKTILVTGGASGMGQLWARRMAAAGARVVAVDLNEAGLADTRSSPGDITTFTCDVTDEAAVTDLVKRVETDLGPIDRLAHAAGIMPAGDVVDVSTERFLNVMRVNYFGTVTMTKAVVPAMVERGSGEVVVFGSVTGFALSSSFAAYCSSKAAVNTYTEILAHELKGSGVHVLLAAPPAVKTPLLDQAAAGGPKAFNDTVAKGRVADPDAVLDAIEKALAKRRTFVLPGVDAKGMYAFRRVSPRLMWRVVDLVNK